MKFKKLNNDFKKRNAVCKYEIKTYLQYKMLSKYWILKKNYQNFFFKKQNKEKNRYFFSQISNICVLTGHTRLVFNKIKISKYKLKNLLNTGFIYNIKPHSW